MITVLTDLVKNSESAYLKVFEASIPVAGKPVVDEVLLLYVPSRDITLDAALCYGKSLGSATASTVFTLKKNGTQVGTFTFAISGTTATISISDTSVAAGDLLTFHAPSSQDATLADIGFTLGGTRN